MIKKDFLAALDAVIKGNGYNIALKAFYSVKIKVIYKKMGSYELAPH
jgi:hypothetical protein